MGVVMGLSAFAAVLMPDLRQQPTSSRLADADNAEMGFIAGADAVRSSP
jgi:hypothetical protein